MMNSSGISIFQCRNMVNYNTDAWLTLLMSLLLKRKMQTNALQNGSMFAFIAKYISSLQHIQNKEQF